MQGNALWAKASFVSGLNNVETYKLFTLFTCFGFVNQSDIL